MTFSWTFVFQPFTNVMMWLDIASFSLSQCLLKKTCKQLLHFNCVLKIDWLNSLHACRINKLKLWQWVPVIIHKSYIKCEISSNTIMQGTLSENLLFFLKGPRETPLHPICIAISNSNLQGKCEFNYRRKISLLKINLIFISWEIWYEQKVHKSIVYKCIDIYMHTWTLGGT